MKKLFINGVHVRNAIYHTAKDKFYIQTGNARVFKIPGTPDGRLTFSNANPGEIGIHRTLVKVNGTDIDEENIATELLLNLEDRD